LEKIFSYLGFKKAGDQELNNLKKWLIQRALEHDKSILLLQLACEKLYKDKIIRPGITRLERIVTRARNRATKETFLQLKPILTAKLKKILDGLLLINPSMEYTSLTWLRKRSTSNSAKEIVTAVEKIKYLRKINVDKWDLSCLNPNRQKVLSKIGRKATNQYLQRLAEERRYPILIAFLKQSLLDISDETIDMFMESLWDFYQDGKKDLQEFHKSTTHQSNEKLIMFKKILCALTNPDFTHTDICSDIFNQYPRDVLKRTLEETGKIIRPHGDGHIDFFARRYSYIRQYAPSFLETFDFKSNNGNDSLLKAITLLRELNVKKEKHQIPDGTPIDFVPEQWKPYVVNNDGSINTRYYELCALWELREAIRACNVWIENSRKHANWDSYFIPLKKWQEIKSEVCSLIGVPEDGGKRLKEREKELKKLIVRVNKLLSQEDNEAEIRLEKGKIIVSPLEADERPESVSDLETEISKRLPKVDITEVIIEVDRWTKFSDSFVHVAGSESRTKELLTHIYASVLAQTCNFGLDQMENNTGIPYRKLAWCTTWYIREETLKPAFSKVVNYQHKLPFAKRWGCGTLSSSDGQRLPVTVKNRHARPLPKYFGYGQGITFYTWTSNQFSQYGIKVTPSTMRDAPFVLDEIMGNETELEILEHTTDTSGNTERIFAAFDLLGIQFSPRLKDIGSQQLYSFKSIDMKKYKNLKSRFKGKTNEKRVLKHWDDFLRIVGSFKLGYVTVSLAMQKLQNLPGKNSLSQAMQEYGRIPKTIQILKWYASKARRRRVNTQLNKSEAVHSLREYLFFANKGEIRHKYYDEMQNQAMCLNLVTNIVILFRCGYRTTKIRRISRQGQ